VTSEAGVLAALAGQVVLVVKASETPQEIVLRAVETLPEDKAVSLVLNQVLSVPERGYGHYGYYGDYGYSRKPEEKAEPIDDESA
jgi:Mrp family chromosome partitioning ATPase